MSHSKRNNNQAHKLMNRALLISGFTLIELLISMMLGSVVMGTALYTMQSTIRVSSEAMTISRVESTGRLAIKHLKKHIEMTGFMGCADPSKTEINDKGGMISNLPPGYVKGFNNYSGSVKAVSKTDAIRVFSATSAQDELTSDMGTLKGNIVTAQNSSSLETGDGAIISNCERADVFAVASIGPVKAKNDLSHRYKSGKANLMKLIDYTYFVGDTGRKDSRGNSVFALFRKDHSNTEEEIITGVENLQILYGTKDSSGNILFQDASNTLDYDDVQLVRVSMIISVESQDSETGNETFTIKDGKLVVGGNEITLNNPGRIHKSFNATFVLRNKVR